ncbi:hypothetical protein DFAR_970012 [Desulfarculales bacterium]
MLLAKTSGHGEHTKLVLFGERAYQEIVKLAID